MELIIVFLIIQQDFLIKYSYFFKNSKKLVVSA